MENVINENYCSGCAACYKVCPKSAIKMVENNEGFYYPEMDEKKCIECGLCKKKCPAKKNAQSENCQLCFAAYAQDKNILNSSSSGGVASVLAKIILEKNGIVIGAYMDENNHVNHISISKKEDISKIQGTKYMQSNIKNAYSIIKENIADKIVLFIGTPCQVAGIKTMFKSKNLICVDLICHGVISRKVFKKYIEEIEDNSGENVTKFNFREKKVGWKQGSISFNLGKTKVIEQASDNYYMKTFLEDIALRESCYECSYKHKNSFADITIGDFWGIEKIKPKLKNVNGVSAVIINSVLGENIFNEAKKYLYAEQTTYAEILQNNKSLENSAKRPRNRSKYYNYLQKNSIKRAYQKSMNHNILKRVYYKIRNITTRKEKNVNDANTNKKKNDIITKSRIKIESGELIWWKRKVP